MTRIIPSLLSYISALLITIPWTQSLPRMEQPRLSIVDWTSYNDIEPQGPGTYAFGYDIEDPATDNVQFRDEERFPNGTVVGSYGYVKPDGNVFLVRYVADARGYRAKIQDSSSQPKHFNQLLPSSRRAPPSVLPIALQSKGIYKNQKVHESRTRPADKIVQNRFESGLASKGSSKGERRPVIYEYLPNNQGKEGPSRSNHKTYPESLYKVVENMETATNNPTFFAPTELLENYMRSRRRPIDRAADGADEKGLTETSGYKKYQKYSVQESDNRVFRSTSHGSTFEPAKDSRSRELPQYSKTMMDYQVDPRRYMMYRNGMF